MSRKKNATKAQSASGFSSVSNCSYNSSLKKNIYGRAAIPKPVTVVNAKCSLQ